VGPNSNSFGFTVRPFVEENSVPRDFLDYQMPAGQSLVDQVTVANLTDDEKTFYLYPADAYDTASGGFALRQRTDPQEDAGTWIKLPVTTYTIPPRSAALVPVELSVPPDATPGDHVAGVVAEEVVAPTTTKDSGGLQQIHRVAARVYVRVAGPAAAQLQVSQIAVNQGGLRWPLLASSNDVTVTYTITNTGNVRVSLNSVKIEVSALFGVSLKSFTAAGDSRGALPPELLPKSRIVLTQHVGSVKPLIRLTARVSVEGTDPVSNSPVRASASNQFWAVPWAIVALLVAGLLAWWVRRRRRRDRQPSSDNTPVTEPTAEHEVLEPVGVGQGGTSSVSEG
jgi:hypothetical protein